MMAKLSELCKNENISRYQIYLPKLHENILNTINLFKEITIGFSHSFQMTLESPASLLDGLFVWISKCCY